MQVNRSQQSLEIVSLDYSALNETIHFAQILQLAKADMKKSPFFIFGALFLTLSMLGMLSAISILIAMNSSNNVGDSIAIIGFFVLIFAGSLALVRSYFRNLSQSYRMSKFANTNSIYYTRNRTEPSYSGLIFNEGHTRSISNAYGLSSLHNTEIGNYSYTTGSGKNRSVHAYGYIMFDLPRNLPHMVLDAKSNNFISILSNLPATFDHSQVLSLEGDFNNYFTLYAPKEYERDALYIFTPDVMQSVIANAKMYDIELVDNKVYLYNKASFDLTNEGEIKNAIKLVSVLVKQFYKQTVYYADNSVGDQAMNTVAPQGKRLSKTRLKTVFSIIMIIAVLYIWLNIGDVPWIMPIFIAIYIFINYYRKTF